MPKAVLVDIDDTLADTQVAMLAYINTKSATPYALEDMTRKHREESVEGYEELVKEFLSQPELVAQARPYEDALSALKKLHDAGYQIHIVSSRREPLHSTTLEWLGTHGFIDYVSRVHARQSSQQGKNFKSEVAKIIKPVAAFDDTLDIALSLAKLDIPVYLIDKPWNAAEPESANIIRVPDFASAVELFLQKES